MRGGFDQGGGGGGVLRECGGVCTQVKLIMKVKTSERETAVLCCAVCVLVFLVCGRARLLVVLVYVDGWIKQSTYRDLFLLCCVVRLVSQQLITTERVSHCLGG